MSFDAKSGILKAINETNDPAMKTVLLLLLGVFEEIGAKIDNFVKNEQSLRDMVLNGHEPVHHTHHEWLEHRIAREEEIRGMMIWIKNKMREETLNKESGRKIRDGVVLEIFKYLVIGGLGLLAGSRFFGA